MKGRKEERKEGRGKQGSPISSGFTLKPGVTGGSRTFLLSVEAATTAVQAQLTVSGSTYSTLATGASNGGSGAAGAGGWGAAAGAIEAAGAQAASSASN